MKLKKVGFDLRDLISQLCWTLLVSIGVLETRHKSHVVVISSYALFYSPSILMGHSYLIKLFFFEKKKFITFHS